MKLTGKCAKAFEKWFKCNPEHNRLNALLWFYHLHPSARYGVYVDFFGSVGIYLIDGWYTYNYVSIVNWKYRLYTFEDGEIERSGFNSRPEARTAAIEKANDCFNKR